MPFRSGSGTSPHSTKMLVELKLRPRTLIGAAVGAEKGLHNNKAINRVRTTLA